MASLWERLPLPLENITGLATGVAIDRPISLRLPTATAGLGALVAVAGLGLNAWAVMARGPGNIDRPDHLVRDGPHKVTRNPMYVGWALLHLGLALAARSPGMLLTWPLAEAAVHARVLREEQELAAQFGSAFDDYRRATPRYVRLGSGGL